MPSRALILISWNGQEPPLCRIHMDARPQFDVLIFDYSGTVRLEAADGSLPCEASLLSAATECKGDIYQHLARYLKALDQENLPEVVGLIDDDVVIGVSDLNRLLHLGQALELDVFSPSLSHDSHFSHRTMLRQPSRTWHPELWVEVMMPVYSTDLFLAASPHFEGNVSSWGIDRYLMPTMQMLLSLRATGVIDAVVATHVRPITSSNKVFRNGLTAMDEGKAMKDRCIALIRDSRPDLIRSSWYRTVFLNRHVRPLTRRISAGIGRRIRQWLERST